MGLIEMVERGICPSREKPCVRVESKIYCPPEHVPAAGLDFFIRGTGKHIGLAKLHPLTAIEEGQGRAVVVKRLP